MSTESKAAQPTADMCNKCQDDHEGFLDGCQCYCHAMAEFNKELLEALEKLEWTSAGVMDQIRGSGPTEMIGAIFEGRELMLNEEAIKATRAAIAKARGAR